MQCGHTVLLRYHVDTDAGNVLLKRSLVPPVVEQWVLRDNITPADVIVRMMFASMPESLRQIYGL